MQRTSEKAVTATDLLALVGLAVLLAALLVPTVVAQQARNKKNDCKNNLKGLGVVTWLYVEKFGSNRNYPPGGGAKTVFSTVRGVPNRKEAVTAGHEKLYCCPVWGKTKPRRGKSDKGMDYASYDGTRKGAIYPGCRLSENAPVDLVIAADPRANHGGKDDGNFLYFSGQVETRSWDDNSPQGYGAKHLSGAERPFP